MGELQVYLCHGYPSDSNATLPWKNTTTVPKLNRSEIICLVNHMAFYLPKRKWLTWEGSEETDQEKIEAIRNYVY